MDKQIFIEKLLDRARQAGFDAAEVYLSEGSEFETAVHKGEITQYNVSDTMALGFRGLKGGKVGSASTQVLDDDAIDMLIRAEFQINRIGIIDGFLRKVCTDERGQFAAHLTA